MRRVSGVRKNLKQKRNRYFLQTNREMKISIANVAVRSFNLSYMKEKN